MHECSEQREQVGQFLRGERRGVPGIAATEVVDPQLANQPAAELVQGPVTHPQRLQEHRQQLLGADLLESHGAESLLALDEVEVCLCASRLHDLSALLRGAQAAFVATPVEALQVAAVAPEPEEERSHLFLRGPQTLQESDATEETPQPALPTALHAPTELLPHLVMATHHHRTPGGRRMKGAG